MDQPHPEFNNKTFYASYEENQKIANTHHLDPKKNDDDVIVSRDALEDLQSRLYCLQAALEDIDRDLAKSREPRDVAEAHPRRRRDRLHLREKRPLP